MDSSRLEGRKEGKYLFNDALNTFYLRLQSWRHTYGKGPLRFVEVTLGVDQFIKKMGDNLHDKRIIINIGFDMTSELFDQ